MVEDRPYHCPGCGSGDTEEIDVEELDTGIECCNYCISCGAHFTQYFVFDHSEMDGTDDLKEKNE